MLLCAVCNKKYGNKVARIDNKIDIVCDDCNWVLQSPKIGTIKNPPSTIALKRNGPCPCDSGMKYKKCCLKKAAEQQAEVAKKLAASETKIDKVETVSKIVDASAATAIKIERLAKS